mmetsp:Transcript_14234/g.33693  ORF Transcript_14234/g.33693 Transcript_14234/m.33693 type:complete len:220 (-) Transcript_14234:1881-2540(-)
MAVAAVMTVIAVAMTVVAIAIMPSVASIMIGSRTASAERRRPAEEAHASSVGGGAESGGEGGRGGGGRERGGVWLAHALHQVQTHVHIVGGRLESDCLHQLVARFPYGVDDRDEGSRVRPDEGEGNPPRKVGARKRVLGQRENRPRYHEREREPEREANDGGVHAVEALLGVLRVVSVVADGRVGVVHRTLVELGPVEPLTALVFRHRPRNQRRDAERQ